MQRVPGLMPQGRNNPDRQRKQGRVQTEKPQSSVRLRPQASPGQYYTRPQQPQRNVKADQFIQALGQVSDVAGTLGRYMHEKRVKEAEQQAAAEMQQMSLEEAQELVQSGEISQYDNPYFQDAFQRQYGIRLGLQRGRDLRTSFETDYDPRSGNVDDFIGEQIGPEHEAMKSNPIIQEAFTETLQEDISHLRAQDQEMKAMAFEQDKLDGAYDLIRGSFDRALDEARTPEERQQAVDSAYQEMRSQYKENRDLLGLSNQEQDALAMQVASHYARNGDLDVVEKILTDNRGGIGAILNKRGQAGADAHEILNLAERQHHQDNQEQSFDQTMQFFRDAQDGQLDEQQVEDYYKQNPGAMSDGFVRSLVRTNQSVQERKRAELAEERQSRALARRQEQERGEVITNTLGAIRENSAHRLEPVAVTADDGEMELLTPEDQLEAAEQVIPQVVSEYASQFPEEEQGMAALNYEIALYSGNPQLENGKWKTTLQGIGTAIGNGGEVNPKIEDGLALYKQLKAKAPGMLDTLITDTDKDVYEALRINEQYMGLDLEQSVQRVHQMQTNDNADNRFATTQYREMEQAIQSLDGFMDGWGQVTNDSYVTSELHRIAQAQARAGGSSDVNTVIERFKEEHSFINGHAVTTRGQNVPPNFSEIAEEKVNQYAQEHQDELEDKGLSAEDLTLFPMGGQGSTGAWAIVDGTSATPMDDQVGSQFTISQLQREVQESREQRAQSAAQGSSVPSIPGVHPAAAAQRADGRGQEPQQEESQDVWDIDMSNATEVPASEPRPEDLPASESVSTARLPQSENPQVRRAVEELRAGGVTKSSFDEYLKTLSRQTNDGQTLQFRFNPQLRERIRYYLPS